MRRLAYVAIFTAALSLILAAPAGARPRTDDDLLGLALGALAVDWAQTRSIADYPQWPELNPILGRRPTRGRVDTYFAACALVLIGATAALDRDDRRAFLRLVILVEGGVVARNLSVGVGLRF
jgi:hypothetical protein